MTPSASRVARAGSSFGILIGIGSSHAAAAAGASYAHQTKNPASRCASAGFKHPGLLASCLTWLASRPAQIDHDDTAQIMTLQAARQVRTGVARYPNDFFDFGRLAP